MKILLAILALCAASVAYGQTQTAHTFSEFWTAPTEYTDGTPIPSGTVITYNWYVGINGPGSEPATPTQQNLPYTSAMYSTNLVAGEDVCGYVTAVVNGVESPHSNESCSIIPAAKPAAPVVTKSSAT